MARLGGAFTENARDFVRLDDPALPESLASYLVDERPLAACAFCLGSSGPALPNRQLNRRGVAAALEEDHRMIAARVGETLKAERDHAAVVHELAEGSRRP